MALTPEQVRQLENNPGIDQTLLGTYKKNNPGSVPAAAVNTVTDPDAAVDRMNKLNVALNTAVAQARDARKDTALDFMGGVIPSGALPGSSFARVLQAFESSNAPLEASLVDNASKFAAEQEIRKEDTKNEIRSLALKVGANGASQDTVNAIAALVESGDIDAAIKIAATALADKGVTYSSEDGTFTDEEGNVVFNSLSGLSKTKAIEKVKATINPYDYQFLAQNLNQEEIISFFQFWMEQNTAQRMTLRMDVALDLWEEKMKTTAEGYGAAYKPKFSAPKESKDKPKDLMEELYGEKE